MLKVVEAFSGIGSQTKALSNLGVKHKVVNTIEWDINAIYAYDLIHNGNQDLSKYKDVKKEELLKELIGLGLSLDGVKPATYQQLNRFSDYSIKAIYEAVKRTNNLVNIKKVTADMFKEDIDIFTYSFPCQDLSLSGYFHGDKGGIDRNARNSSSTLWEVERILNDFRKKDVSLPKVLLMENVTSIRSSRHIKNFNEWKEVLKKLGYVNYVEDVSAIDHGIPQKRVRTFMISIIPSNKNAEKNIIKYFKEKPLLKKSRNIEKVENFLRLDYKNEQYLKEALEQNPNFTPSRVKILKENDKILDESGKKVIVEQVRTLTTKQDRHPNSGTLYLPKEIRRKDKSPFRYITPREAFLLMGFSENDYDMLLKNNIKKSNSQYLLTNTKLSKMAGNSIVVPVLEHVFSVIINTMKIDRGNK